MHILNSFKAKVILKIKLELGSQAADAEEYKTTAGEDILVLPSKKRGTKVKKTEGITRILSRKQRKRLEKIVEKKKKKENVGFNLWNDSLNLFN